MSKFMIFPTYNFFENYAGGMKIPLDWVKQRQLGIKIADKKNLTIGLKGIQITPQDLSVFQTLLTYHLGFESAHLHVQDTFLVCVAALRKEMREETVLMTLQELYSEENNKREDVTQNLHEKLLKLNPLKIYYGQNVSIDEEALSRQILDLSYIDAPDVFVRPS